MAQAKYPDEAPVFELTEDGAILCRGAIVEGLGPEVHGGHPDNGLAVHVTAPGWIGVRALDDADVIRAGPRHPDGWRGVVIAPECLHPLTPAAVAMLELVK